MDMDIIKNNTLIGSLTDVQFQISKPYNENDKKNMNVFISQPMIGRITEEISKEINKKHDR